MFQLWQKILLCQYLSQPAKKLDLVSATSLLVIETSKKKHVSLEQVLYIYYLLHFWKDTASVRALIDLSSDVNAMILAYASKLDLKVYLTNVRAQKIDGFTLETFGMVLASFEVEDKLGRAQLFQKTFLVADISTEVVLNMSFLTFSNANVSFVEK